MTTLADPRHGTETGWHAHYSQAVPVCDPCTEARRAIRKARRSKQGLSTGDRP